MAILLSNGVVMVEIEEHIDCDLYESGTNCFMVPRYRNVHKVFQLISCCIIGVFAANKDTMEVSLNQGYRSVVTTEQRASALDEFYLY